MGPILAPLRSLGKASRALMVRVAKLAAIILWLASPAPAPAVEAPADPVAANTQIALVIGNGAYGDLGKLPNPTNDAADIAAALTDLDFDVSLVRDGDVVAVRRALRDFGNRAAGADVALFYYAGHGMAMNGENYLIPVNADIQTPFDLNYETLPLGDVREALEFTNAKLKMVILDACRDNPLAKVLQRNSAERGRNLQSGDGLARMDVDRASGMFIAYATAPGNLALDGSKQRNSPFTKALLAHIADPNTDVRVMFGKVRADVVKATNSFQTPWTEEAMLGEFQFNPVATEPPPPPEPTLPPDFIAWNAVAQSEDPADLEGFLTRFPESTLAGAARDRLKVMRDPATEAAAWNALQGSGDVATYEKFLRRYPSGPFSGAALATLQSLLGARLVASNDVDAMEAYAARFPASPLTPLVRQQAEKLRAEAEASPVAAAPAPAAAPVLTAAAPPASGPAPAAAAMPEPGLAGVFAATDGAQPSPMELAMVDPLAPLADAGDRAEERALRMIQPPEGGEPHAIAPEADLTPAAVDKLREHVVPVLIQMALAALDHYHGAPDGKFGPASRRAATAFQRDLGTPDTGELQPVEIVALIGKAARSGDPQSQTVYGGMLMTGAGVKTDLAAAAKWYELSARAGNGYGQLNLGIAYLEGAGVAKDHTEARRWLEAALGKGIEEAREPLSQLQ